MTDKHYVGETGTYIVVSCGFDMSEANVTQMRVVKPDGTVEMWDATPTVGDPTLIAHTTVEGDLDQAGRYALNAYVDVAGWIGHGETAYFVIYELE